MDSNTGSIETHNPTEPTNELPATEPITIPTIEDRTTPTAVLQQEIRTNIPDRPEGIVIRKRHLAIGGGVLVVVAGASLVGGLFLANQGNSPKVDGAIEKDTTRHTSAANASPVATAEATPSETPTPVETDAQNAGITTPELSSSSSPDELATDVITQALINWRNAGITATLSSDQAASGLAAGDYAASTAQKAANTYENALFIDDWQTHQDLLAYAQTIQAQNNENIYLSLATAKEANPFHWGIDSEKLVNQSDSANEIDLTIVFREFQNGTENSAMDIDSSLVHNVSTYQRVDVKLLKSGDSMKISAISKIADPQP